MIGKLRGLLDSIGDEGIVLDVNGVGYVVQCSSRTLQSLPRPGEPMSLAIETQVREDAIRLFGFGSEAERDWFRLLQTVQGVGAKVALAILGTLGADELSQAIALEDRAMIARAQGVGPKLAARIAAELKDKGPASGSVAAEIAVVADAALARQPVQDAISALVNLGYARAQAALAITASAKALGDGAETSALIRRGLKELAS